MNAAHYQFRDWVLSKTRRSTTCYMAFGGMNIPILPERFVFTLNTDQEQYQIVGGSEVNIPKGAKLFTSSIEGMLPYLEANRPWVSEDDQSITPDIIRENLMQWAENKEVISFEFHTLGWSVEADVTIEDPEFEEEGGAPGDLFYRFSFREYVDPKAKQVEVSSSGNSSKETRKTTVSKSNQNTTYTVKSGDCLYSIAKSQLGDSSRWREIYELNKDIISNPNLIYPGQELKLPVDASGKTAGSNYTASTVKPDQPPSSQSLNTASSGGSTST